MNCPHLLDSISYYTVQLFGAISKCQSAFYCKLIQALLFGASIIIAASPCIHNTTEIGHLIITGTLKARHHVFKRIAGRRRRICFRLIDIGIISAGTAAVPLRIVAAAMIRRFWLRRKQRLNGKSNLIVLIDGNYLCLNTIANLQVFVDVLDIGVCNL